MISERQRLSLDPIAAEVLRQFEQRFKDLRSEIKFDEDLQIYLPAKNPVLGIVAILSEFDEVTVYMGEFFHEHFGAYRDEERLTPESLEAGVSEVMDFVQEIVEDKIVLEVVYKGDEIVSAACWNIENDECPSTPNDFGGTEPTLPRSLPEKTRVEKHVWSGTLLR